MNGRYQQPGRLLARIGLLLAGLAGVLVTLPALANFGAVGDCGYRSGNSSYNPPTNCVSKANNRWHAVRFAGLGNSNGWQGIDDAVQWVLTNRLNPTDLVAYRDDSDPVPDVWAMDNTYGQSFPVGWVDCPADNSGIGGTGANRWCRGQYLRFNASWQATLAGEEKEIACHELGHTVGLRHNNHNYVTYPA